VDKAKEKVLREESKTRNDHTGAELKSKVATDKYRDNYDKIKWTNG